MSSLRRYRLFSFALTFLLTMGVGQAQNVLSISSASGHPGDEVELSVTLDVSETATALQMEISLPDYLNYVEGSALLNTTRVANSHQLSVSQANGRLKFYIYSLTLESIQSGSGQLLSFRLSLGKTPSQNELKPEVMMSNAQGQNIITTTRSGKVTILCPEISLTEREIHFGNVPIRSTYTRQIEVSNTGNEPLTLSDATSNNEHFQLNATFPITIASGSQKQLTVTYAPIPYGDENCAITLESNAINGNQTLHLDASPYSVNTLSASSVTGKSDEEVTVSVFLQNMEPIVAAQCTFELPEALQYVEGSALLNASRVDATHQISRSLSDGKLTFYIHSSTNQALISNDGLLFTFRLLLNGAGGTYPLLMKDAILSNRQGVDMTSGFSGSEVRIAAPRLSVEQQVDFGEIPMEESARKIFTLRNSGETALTIQRIEFTNQIFSLEDPNLPTIESGTSKDIILVCQPDGEGELSGTMQIYSNDPDNRMQNVELTGKSYPTNQLFLSGSPVGNHPDEYAVTLSMQNSLPIVALQFDIHWTAEMQTTRPQLALTSRAPNHEIALSQLSDDTYRIYIYSMDNTPIAAGEGELLTIIYNNVEDSYSYAGTIITLDNVILSTKEEQNRASSFTTSMTVEPDGLLGDANGDGYVTVTDVVCVVEYILGRQPETFNKKLADVTQDDDITIGDIVGIINIIMLNQ